MGAGRHVLTITLTAVLAAVVTVMLLPQRRPPIEPPKPEQTLHPRNSGSSPGTLNQSPRWDREAAAASLLLLFSGGWDAEYLEAMKALGTAGAREVVRRLVRTQNSPPRKRDDVEVRSGVDADSIVPLLQILAQLKSRVPGAADEIVAWAQGGHAALYNRQILAALESVGGPEEGGRAAGVLLQAEIARFQSYPNRNDSVLLGWMLRELPRRQLTGVEDVLLKLYDPQGSGSLGVDPADPSFPSEVEHGLVRSLAGLNTPAGAKALASAVHELNDASRRDSVLEAIAEAVRENPEAKVAGLLRDWAPSWLISSSASPAERKAAFAIAAGMDRETVRQLCDARPDMSEEKLFADWLDGVVTAAGRHPEAADLCGKLIEEGAMRGNLVGEDLNKRLIHAYIRGDSDRRRHVMSLVSSVTPIEALAIVLAFPAEAWKEHRDLLKGAVEKFHPQKAEGSIAGMAAQFAADRWLDTSENVSEDHQVMQSLAPGMNLGRRHREPDFALPKNPTADELTRLAGILKVDPKRRGLLINLSTTAEDSRIPADTIARVCEAPGLTPDFFFAVARGLLARKTPEARKLAEVLLLKAAPGPWSPPGIEVNFWRVIVLLSVRDDQGRALARKCLEAREAGIAPLPASLAPKLEALKSFLEKCRDSESRGD